MATLNQAYRLSVLITLMIHASTLSSSSYSEHEKGRIWELPGQGFNITFSHFSGYITVDKSTGRSLFYWFIEAEKDPSSKPLVLWLNGGPGCSSIAYGEAEEIGPFHINKDGKTLYLNPFSWNKFANILFLDSPAGVGFSYNSNSSSADLLNNGDHSTAMDSLSFLLQWFLLFPHYKGREFFITGESYAGHYVPQLSHVIVNNNKRKPSLHINLKGFMVGNALTDDYHDHLGVSQFLWSSGLISDQTYKKLNLFCDFQSFINPSPACDKILEVSNAEMGNIDPYSIFTPVCNSKKSNPPATTRRRWMMRTRRGRYDPCTEEHSVAYFNRGDVQKALHVDDVFRERRWETCNDVVYHNWRDSSASVLWIYRELIGMGLRLWMFSGDTDSVIPVTSTRYSIDSLKLETVNPWRAWYEEGDDDDGGEEVGGWTEEYRGLTFVTVRGAGHEVALHRPKLALILFKCFLAGESMPGSSSLVRDS